MGIEINGQKVGNVHFSILDPVVVQEAGDSQTNVMSQKAVTDGLSGGNLFDLYTFVEGKYYDGNEGTNSEYKYCIVKVKKGVTYVFSRKIRMYVIRANGEIVQSNTKASHETDKFTANYDGQAYITVYAQYHTAMYVQPKYKELQLSNEGVNGHFVKTDGVSTIYDFDFSTTEGDIVYLKTKYSGWCFTHCQLYEWINDGWVTIKAFLTKEAEYAFVAKSVSKYRMYLALNAPDENGFIEFSITNLSKATVVEAVEKLSLENRVSSSLFMKKIACLGDSFTYGNDTYVKKMNSAYLCNAINYGVPSSRIVRDTTSGGTTVLSFLNRYAEMDGDADIVTIFGGINDAWDLGNGDLELGSIDSEANTSTFYGGLKMLVTFLIEKYPDKQIIGIIPPDCQSGLYYIEKLPLVQKAEREVYNMYGVPYIDIKQECFKMSTLPAMVALYRSSATDIHPSNEGQKALCDTISAGLRRIIF